MLVTKRLCEVIGVDFDELDRVSKESQVEREKARELKRIEKAKEKEEQANEAPAEKNSFVKLPEKIGVVNYHFTGKCNFSCVFCFAKDRKIIAPQNVFQQFKIINEIKAFFDKQGIKGRINFAGGEPLLDDSLPLLLEFCQKTGIETSIITNGFLLTKKLVNKFKELGVGMIGISVDSLDEISLKQMGRVTKEGKTLCLQDLVEVCSYIKEKGIKLKINSCVSKFNHTQDLSALFGRISIDRFKIIRAYEVQGINTDSNAFVTDSQFEDFCKRHSMYNPIVEDNKDLEGSYIIIYPDGRLVCDRGNQYKVIGNILRERLMNLIEKKRFNFAGYAKRYDFEKQVLKEEII